MNNRHLPWAYSRLSMYLTVTIDTVLATPDFPWDWGHLTRNSKITIDMVMSNLGRPWDWSDTTDIIYKDCGIRDNDEVLPSKKNIERCFSAVLARPDLPWNWVTLSICASLDIIEANMGLPWDGEGLSSNPHITSDFVIQHPEFIWDFGLLSINKFLH
jgi:hypothetical protein